MENIIRNLLIKALHKAYFCILKLIMKNIDLTTLENILDDKLQRLKNNYIYYILRRTIYELILEKDNIENKKKRLLNLFIIQLVIK